MPSLAAPDQEAIIAKEKAVWQAFKDKKVDDLRRLLSPDVVSVYADGIVNMQERLGDMSKNDMKAFSVFPERFSYRHTRPGHRYHRLQVEDGRHLRRERRFRRLQLRDGLEFEERRMARRVSLRHAGGAA